jgi:hypothetical protein
MGIEYIEYRILRSKFEAMILTYAKDRLLPSYFHILQSQHATYQRQGVDM